MLSIPLHTITPRAALREKVVKFTISFTLMVLCFGLVAAPAAGELLEVQLPHGLRDASGQVWELNQNGAIEGSSGIYEGGGYLIVEGADSGYVSNANTATFDSAANELIFPPFTISGLNISRRVAVDEKAGWCRFVEVLENPAAEAIHVRLRLTFSFVEGVAGTTLLSDRARPDDAPRALAASDERQTVLMIGAGPGARLKPQFIPQPDQGFVQISYDVQVPAHKTVALAHFHLLRPSPEAAAQSLGTLRERDLLRNLPRDVRDSLLNFRPAGAMLGDIEVLRGDTLDVVELRGGDRYNGTIREASFKLQTPYGLIELPPERVIGIANVGIHQPTQLLITASGEVFGGTLEAPSLHLQLSNGQITDIPIDAISRLGYRKRAGEPEGLKFDKPLLLLAAGDRISVDPPASPIPLMTRYGLVRVDPKSIASISMEDQEQPAHEMRLVDGSRLSGIVALDKLSLKPLSIGAANPITFAMSGVRGMQLAAEASPSPAEDAAIVQLTSGDLLVGTLSGRVVLETTFDIITIDAAEIAALAPETDAQSERVIRSPADVRLTLWDGAEVGGRLKEDALAVQLQSGSQVKVPLALLGQYVQPLPTPPPQAMEQIKAAVADLSAADPARRDRAQELLRSMGSGIHGVLRKLSDAQPEAAQELIRAIVSGDASSAPPPPAEGEPPLAPQPVEDDIELQIEVDPAEEVDLPAPAVEE